MRHIGRRTRLRSTTAAAAVMVAAAALVAPSGAQATTKKSSPATPSVQESTPSGAVGGIRSPMEAGSTLNLVISASEANAGLVSAQATINGVTSSVSLCPESLAGKCPESVTNVPLSIGVGGGAGSYQLFVTVTDVAGNTGTLAQQTIEVLAPAPPAGNTVTVGISARREGPPGEEIPEEPEPEENPHKHPHEEPPPEGPPVCASPMLEMHLASKPRGYTAGHVPELLHGRRYRFAGQLTCLDGHRRVSAPNGTPVRVFYRYRTCTQHPARCTLHLRTFKPIRVRGGHLRVRLEIVGPGTITFIYRPRGGESVQVSLPVAIAHPRDASRRR